MQTGYVPGLASFAGSDPTTAEWRYELTDHLGSVRHLTGQNKAALARYDYAPYGELMRHAGLPLTVGYTGHRWDAAIGQYFAPFRYYNPQTARWNMRDPLGMIDGPNVYAYVVGNPVNYVDPSGRCFTPETVWDAANVSYDLVYGSWTDLIFDGIALAVPVLPGGLTKVDDVIKIAKKERHHRVPRFLGGDDALDNIFDFDYFSHRKYHKDRGHFTKEIRDYLKKEMKEFLDIMKNYTDYIPKDSCK